ncbi:hypothetical protein K435DRAFT_874532 [Dendrothele bispora CBS 962.96]|uniref:Uncharacterized protein n=1 Tax=Dendrothele bispora (strain CBS 962.96) TaxID=1314807 RepID=A0A4S8KXH5_DENBC|nr:hypothetical protein K435DRAFT_874532 [Dendrothele bispora CBS 962.96]
MRCQYSSLDDAVEEAVGLSRKLVLAEDSEWDINDDVKKKGGKVQDSDVPPRLENKLSHSYTAADKASYTSTLTTNKSVTNNKSVVSIRRRRLKLVSLCGLSSIPSNSIVLCTFCILFFLSFILSQASQKIMDSQSNLKSTPIPTAEELDKNHNLLLHRSATTARPANAHDASLAAVVPGGRFFITTPYRNLSLHTMRRDFRFGEHDYLQWPQQWCLPLCHLACILRRPSPGHQFDLMWWVPTPEYFCEERRGIATGLGKLNARKAKEFGDLVSDLRARCNEFVAHHSNPTEVDLARQYSEMLLERKNRLNSLLLSYRQMCYAVTSVQRLFLELHALLEYCQTFKPRMKGVDIASPTVAPVIGAYTSDLQQAEALFRAGLPFWFVRQVQDVPAVTVGKLVPLVSVDTLCRAESPFPEPVVFRGVPNTLAQYNAIQDHLNTVFNTHSPFESSRHSRLQIASPSTAIVGGIQRTATERKRQTPYPKKSNKPSKVTGRDKFSLPEHHLFPPSSPCWASALSRVNRDYPPDPVQGGYAFPDPILFVSVGKHEKTLTYCWNYLQFWDILLFRISQPSPQLIPNSTWRQLLNGEFAATTTGAPSSSKRSSKTALQKASVRELLGNCLLSTGVDVDLEHPLKTVSWRGRSFHYASEIPEDVVREIVWELSHLNFRCELVALDKVLVSKSLDNEESLRHCRRLGNCFPGADMDNILTVDIDRADDHEGFGSAAPVGRKGVLFALRDVMNDWPKFGERCRNAKDALEKDFYNDTTLEVFEAVVVHGYLQYFFDTFGRAAVTPLRLDRSD